MNSTLTEVVIIIALILANGLFAMSEIALVSSRKARIQKAARHGVGKAQAVLKLQESPIFLQVAVQKNSVERVKKKEA
jgi:putative hemolysin